MESRMDKYYREEVNPNMQRSSKNAKLYKEVYSNYDNLENLPIPDNTNEIDMPELRKLMRGEKNSVDKVRNNDNETNYTNDKPDANKIYDINKLLEHAKSENNKLKDNKHYDSSNYKILETLGDSSEPISYEDVEEDKVNKEDVLSQTRELKYQTKKISDNPVIEQIIPEDSKEFNTASLSLDILSDLKPNGDTGVTKPVSEPAFDKIYEDVIEEKVDTVLENNDDSDINIIKENVEEERKEEVEKDTSFYTDFYKFSNKDFEDDDDDDDESKGGVVFKIILLFIFIVACCFAIFYFITNYGFN